MQTIGKAIRDALGLDEQPTLIRVTRSGLITWIALPPATKPATREQWELLERSGFPMAPWNELDFDAHMVPIYAPFRRAETLSRDRQNAWLLGVEARVRAILQVADGAPFAVAWLSPHSDTPAITSVYVNRQPIGGAAWEDLAAAGINVAPPHLWIQQDRAYRLAELHERDAADEIEAARQRRVSATAMPDPELPDLSSTTDADLDATTPAPKDPVGRPTPIGDFADELHEFLRGLETLILRAVRKVET